jgi:hypothetical protein
MGKKSLLDVMEHISYRKGVALMAQQSSQPERLKPNRYVLKLKHATVTYDVTAIDGKPHLTYQVLEGPASRTFIGDQIRIQESAIGTLVTVTLEAIPDDKATLLTLLLPVINLVGTTEQDFATLGVTTTERSSIAGPSLVNGVVQTYREKKVEGKAQFVET